MSLAISIVIPALDERAGIVAVLNRIFDSVQSSCEILVVVDDEADSTVPVLRDYARAEPRLRTLINTYGRGPANAIRYGIDHAESPIIVVTMADGSDDPRQIDSLARLVERGVVVAAASRYSAGGQQVGGALLKGLLSRSAGRSLGVLARVGTYDATNTFKAYSSDFVRQVGIDSCSGYEIGLELTAKARRLRRPVAEIPTIWLDRSAGAADFDLKAWIPRYLRWYRFAYGPRMTVPEVIEEAGKIARRNRREAERDRGPSIAPGK